MSSKEMILHSFDGVELYCRQDIPDMPTAIVIIVHGLGEHCGRYDEVTASMNECGYGVVRYDNRGHGKSGGARGYLEHYLQYIDDADFMVEWASKQYPKLPLFMLGHSMGGFISAAYGVRYPGKLRGQILSGACIIKVPGFANLETVNIDENPLMPVPNGLSHLICRSQKVVDDYNQDYFNLKEFTLRLLVTVFRDGVQWLMNHVEDYHYPCLLLHGAADQIVPQASAEFLYRNAASHDKTLTVYPELYHEILNEEAEKQEIMAAINTWIGERL